MIVYGGKTVSCLVALILMEQNAQLDGTYLRRQWARWAVLPTNLACFLVVALCQTLTGICSWAAADLPADCVLVNSCLWIWRWGKWWVCGNFHSILRSQLFPVGDSWTNFNPWRWCRFAILEIGQFICPTRTAQKNSKHCLYRYFVLLQPSVSSPIQFLFC